MKIPKKEECLELLKKNNTPENVIAHSKAVCKAALEIADKLIEKGVKVNRDLVLAGALLHDIAKPSNYHSVKGAEIIEKIGFKEVAELIKKHALSSIREFQPKTIEEKILFYVDKIVEEDKVVSVEERFEGFARRHGKHKDADYSYKFTKRIEKELKEMMG